MARPSERPTAGDAVENALSSTGDALSSLGEKAADALDSVKPRLRGWIHAGTFPVALVASIVLVVLAPPVAGKVACAIFGLSACLLFGTSAVYHRGNWSPKVAGILRRADHSNIFLIIAGTYTPLAVLLLPKQTATILLVIVWAGALLGVGFRVFWADAPRWLYVPIYIALGWAAVFFIPGLLDGALELGMGIGVATFVMIVAGGMLYTLGGVVYGFQRPNPWPQWFGFHEVFHTFTILAFATHYVGVSLATYSLR